MGKWKYKNTFKIIKSKKKNMASPETSGYSTARSEHLNTDEAEESDLKYNIMEMIEKF